MSRLSLVLIFVGFILLFIWAVAAGAFSTNIIPFMWVLLAGGLLSFFVAIIRDAKYFKNLFGQRATKQGMSLGVLIILITGIVGVVDYLAFKHNKKADFTREKLFSLAPQTKELISALDSDLNVVGFFEDKRPDVVQEKMKFQDLIGLIETQNSKVKVRYVNPIKKPDEAKAYDVVTASTVVLEYKGKKTKIDEYTEQSFINALIKLKKDKNKAIYFVSGHGELDVEGNDPLGASNLKRYLTDGSYEVKKLNFFEKAEIPQDAEVVVVAGPKQAYLPSEIKILKDLLARGGRLIVALDPGTKNNLGSEFIRDFGVEFKNNYVLDLNGEQIGGSPAMAVGLVFSPSHEITKSFKPGGTSVTLFHLASQLKNAIEKPAGMTIEDIVKTSQGSFTKQELKTGEARPIPGKDDTGPLTVASVVTGKMSGSEKEFQLIIFGDSDFLSNRLVDALGNHDLVLNTISFAAKDADQVTIRPKAREGQQLMLTMAHKVILPSLLVLALPLAIFITGGFVYLRRRAA